LMLRRVKLISFGAAPLFTLRPPLGTVDVVREALLLSIELLDLTPVVWDESDGVSPIDAALCGYFD
jgi:hypothetical protein